LADADRKSELTQLPRAFELPEDVLTCLAVEVTPLRVEDQLAAPAILSLAPLDVPLVISPPGPACCSRDASRSLGRVMSDPIAERRFRHAHRAADANGWQRSTAHHLVNLAATQAERAGDLFGSHQEDFVRGRPLFNG
jgi:hypothetical protein